eukprot:SAG31_NODE_25331_length_463_cov_1.134615_2_plen_52_part_00
MQPARDVLRLLRRAVPGTRVLGIEGAAFLHLASLELTWAAVLRLATRTVLI